MAYETDPTEYSDDIDELGCNSLCQPFPALRRPNYFELIALGVAIFCSLTSRQLIIRPPGSSLEKPGQRLELELNLYDCTSPSFIDRNIYNTN
jgi:hypothetical protein